MLFYHVTPWYMSYHVMFHIISSDHTVSCHVMLCHVYMSACYFHTISCLSFCVMSTCYIMFHLHNMSCHAIRIISILCYVMFIMLCHVYMFVMLFHVHMFHVISYDITCHAIWFQVHIIPNYFLIMLWHVMICHVHMLWLHAMSHTLYWEFRNLIDEQPVR